jgi:predicted dehydrogenase
VYVTDRQNSMSSSLMVYIFYSTAAPDATMLHIMVGHLLDPFLKTFGDVASLTATQTVAFPTAAVCDSNGVETGATVPVSSPDQLSFSLLTKTNVLCSFHYRAGLPMTEGRTNFLWLIDGTNGTIRLEGDGRAGSFLNIVDPVLSVNGQRVEVTTDPLGKVGRSWTEFARDSSEANYATADDAVRVHRVIEAILKSAEKNTPVVMN